MTLDSETDGTLGARALTLVLAVAVAQVTLVATHRGEFWPFSTFCMFSRAGKPWSRALVRNVDGYTVESYQETTYSLDDLPGRPVAVTEETQNDLSKLVQRAEAWTDIDKSAVKRALGVASCRDSLVVLRVEGNLVDDVVEVVAKPVALIGCGRMSVHQVHALLPEHQ